MYNNPYERHFEIDVKKFPVIVIESDDWGACEVIPDAKMLDKYNSVMKKYNKSQGGESSSLERPDELFTKSLKLTRGLTAIPQFLLLTPLWATPILTLSGKITSLNMLISR